MSGRIELEGATNFRDLGGYLGAGGRPIRSGRVFRSDGLHRLTASDHKKFETLGIARVCDLRYSDERAREPSRLPSGVQAIHVGLTERPSASSADALDGESRTEEKALEYLRTNYEQYPHLYAGAYRTILGHLLHDDGGLVFHCTAGKDRAGLAAVVVLTALGVDPEQIRRDYLLTNDYWDRGDRPPSDWPTSVVEAIFTARELYLDAALTAIDRDFGSFERFLTDKVGFGPSERDALQARLLAE